MAKTKTNTPLTKDSPPPKPAEPQVAAPAGTAHRGHWLRRLVAGCLGSLTVSLILSALIFGWLNYTLVNSQRYLATVGPLATQPRIQNYIIGQVSKNLLDNTSASQLAKSFNLNSAPGLPTDQLKAQLAQPVRLAVTQAVDSAQFSQTWRQINQDLHDQLLAIAKGNSQTASLDLKPSLDRLVALLKNSRLSFIDTNNLTTRDTHVTLNQDQIRQIRKVYKGGQDSLRALVILAVIFTIATLMTANRRLHSLRQLAIWTGLSTLLIVLIIQLPGHLAWSNLDSSARGALIATEQTLLRGLLSLSKLVLVTCLAVMTVCSWLIWRQRLKQSQ